MVPVACCSFRLSSRMRILSSFPRTMASPFTIHRLHMRGRSRLLKCLNTVETVFRRSVGTEPIVAQTEGVQDTDCGQCEEIYSIFTDQLCSKGTPLRTPQSKPEFYFHLAVVFTIWIVLKTARYSEIGFAFT